MPFYLKSQFTKALLFCCCRPYRVGDWCAERSFHILDGPLPRCLVQSARDKNQGQATVDKLVNVCAALVNMAQNIIK